MARSKMVVSFRYYLLAQAIILLFFRLVSVSECLFLCIYVCVDVITYVRVGVRLHFSSFHLVSTHSMSVCISILNDHFFVSSTK